MLCAKLVAIFKFVFKFAGIVSKKNEENSADNVYDRIFPWCQQPMMSACVSAKATAPSSSSRNNHTHTVISFVSVAVMLMKI